MSKVVLIIFEKEGRYHAEMHVGESTEFTQKGEPAYQISKEVKNVTEARTSFKELKSEAKKWARKQGIEFVYNLDTELYP